MSPANSHCLYHQRGGGHHPTQSCHCKGWREGWVIWKVDRSFKDEKSFFNLAVGGKILLKDLKQKPQDTNSWPKMLKICVGPFVSYKLLPEIYLLLMTASRSAAGRLASDRASRRASDRACPILPNTHFVLSVCGKCMHVAWSVSYLYHRW